MSYYATKDIMERLGKGELIHLNLGSGPKRSEGVTNLDILESVKPDIICDLEHEPIPLPDNSCHRIEADYIMEHLSNTLDVLTEIWRISIHGAMVYIGVPYCMHAAAFRDPTHNKFFDIESYRYWDARETLVPHYDYKGMFRVSQIQTELDPSLKLPVLKELEESRLREMVFQIQHGCNYQKKINFFLEAIKEGPEASKKVESKIQCSGFIDNKVMVYPVIYTEVNHD